MPPSTIPQAQVQQIIAELRASETHPDLPREYAEPARDPWRGRALAAAGLLGVGIVIGIGFGVLGPGFAKKPRPSPAPMALVMTAPVRVDTPSPPAPVALQPVAAVQPAPAPSAPVQAAPAPKPIVLAAAAPSLRPPVALDTVEKVKIAPKPCLNGGPCGRDDVQAAERRLEYAFRAAQRRGASPSKLAGVRQRWNGLKAAGADSPTATVASYRKLTAELYAKPARAAAKAKPAKPVRRRAAPAHEAPLPFRRAR